MGKLYSWSSGDVNRLCTCLLKGLKWDDFKMYCGINKIWQDTFESFHAICVLIQLFKTSPAFKLYQYIYVIMFTFLNLCVYYVHFIFAPLLH